MRYSAFVFESYRYDPANCALSLRYCFADGPRFEETLIFELPPRLLSLADKVVLDRIFRLIFLLAGVSYYKAYAPPSLVCKAFPLDRRTAAFLQSFYENGLAEFARTAAAQLGPGGRGQGFGCHHRMPQGGRRGPRTVLIGRRSADRCLHRRGRTALHPGSPPPRPRPREAQQGRRAQRPCADYRDLERDRP